MPPSSWLPFLTDLHQLTTNELGPALDFGWDAFFAWEFLAHALSEEEGGLLGELLIHTSSWRSMEDKWV
jgi:hypothetical protein